MDSWRTAGGWFRASPVVALAAFILGWILVAGPGQGGSDDTGPNLAWQVGGLMVYLAFPVGLVIGAAGALTISLRARRPRRPVA